MSGRSSSRFSPDDPVQDEPTTWKFAVSSPATSLIGREQEIAGLTALLADGQTRLVTLTGPGGVGKTRLAQRIAEHANSSRGDAEVVFLALASITDPELVASTIGRAFGLNVSDADALPDRLALALDGQACLLVLDNFEQILAAAPLIANLVTSCPSLTVLVTSRSPLRLSAEHLWPVPSLTLPEPGSSPEQANQSAAVQLFVERAVGLSGQLIIERSSSVAAICRRLDGLPLAIELAAANTRVLSPSELLDRMDCTLPLLAGGPRDAPARLQTMHNAIAWSYDLLSDEQQRLFRALSVFQGGFTVAAAEAIAPADLETPPIQGLTALIDQSLVLRMPGDREPSRFTMLETVREFGLEALRARGEEEMYRERHLAWLIEQLGSPGPEIWIDAQRGRALLLPNEQDNLRSAMSWALEQGEPASAAQIAWGLLPFWRSNGLFREGATRLVRIAGYLRPINPALSAGMMCRATDLVAHLGDLVQMTALASSTLQTFRELEHPVGMLLSLQLLGLATRWTDGPAAIAMFTEASEISLSLGDTVSYASILRSRAVAFLMEGELQNASADMNIALPMQREPSGTQSGLAFALGTGGWVAGLHDELETAEQLTLEALAMSVELQIPECQIYAHRILGNVAFQRQNVQLALDHFRLAFQTVFQSSMHTWEGFCLTEFAHIAESQGHRTQAARLYGAADAAWRRLGIPTPARMFAGWTGHMTIDPQWLADPAIASAFAEGQNLSSADAYAEAMTVTVTPQSTRSSGSMLSSRELEVLTLIAGGHTNQEIAERLFISKRTVDSHVVSILSKLGVDSRRAAVATARDRCLLPKPAIDA